MISEFNERDRIQGQFLVGSVTKGNNASGSLYLNIEFNHITLFVYRRK